MNAWRTCSAIDVVEVTYAVLVRPTAGLAIESGLSRASSPGVLYDHSFIQVLVQLQGAFTPLH